MKLMLVHFDNGNTYTIKMNSSTTAQKLVGMVKHLRPLTLRFENYDNPYNHTLEIATTQLQEHADQLGVLVNADQLHSQLYLNHLHELYEQGYDGTPNWLQFHEAIHMIESVVFDRKSMLGVNLTYGEKSGPLDQTYTFDELTTIKSQVAPGECYIEFNELGKTPLQYFVNCEPNNIQRFCELAKPFIRLNFKLTVALDPIDFMPDPALIEQYQTWLAPHYQTWCQHWNIPDWTVEQTVGVLPVGQIDHVDLFKYDIASGAKPIGLSLA